ncbi:MAG: hypothetical protein R3354_04250 [Thiohalomonadales bacterium]|nr:hypothetical protein [Thiohalomonadales bacterium]
MKRYGLLLLMLVVTNMVSAGQVTIRHVEFEKQGASWTVAVTLQHADTGWDHYADGWRIVTVDGTVLGHRTLYHPHVNEQPFTRNLSGVMIPPEIDIVFIEAHDKVHGWNPQRLEVNLQQDQGDGYRVRR